MLKTYQFAKQTADLCIQIPHVQDSAPGVEQGTHMLQHNHVATLPNTSRDVNRTVKNNLAIPMKVF